MSRRLIRTILLTVGLAACLGCGGERDKDKNKDLDRPRPAEKGK
jgi:hypothetical protein